MLAEILHIRFDRLTLTTNLSHNVFKSSEENVLKNGYCAFNTIAPLSLDKSEIMK